MRVIHVALLLTTVLTSVACGGGVPRPVGGPGGPTAVAAVERFLQLARTQDFVQMGWVFGTSEGPVIQRDPVSDVERRMYALASVLQYDTFVPGPGMPVPGRTGAAEMFKVRLTRGTQTTEVPITVVRGPDRLWFVEQVAVEAVTNNR